VRRRRPANPRIPDRRQRVSRSRQNNFTLRRHLKIEIGVLHAECGKLLVRHRPRRYAGRELPSLDHERHDLRFSQQVPALARHTIAGHQAAQTRTSAPISKLQVTKAPQSREVIPLRPSLDNPLILNPINRQVRRFDLLPGGRIGSQRAGLPSLKPHPDRHAVTILEDIQNRFSCIGERKILPTKEFNQLTSASHRRFPACNTMTHKIWRYQSLKCRPVLIVHGRDKLRNDYLSVPAHLTHDPRSQFSINRHSSGA
jgi:hypothetical protein